MRGRLRHFGRALFLLALASPGGLVIGQPAILAVTDSASFAAGPVSPNSLATLFGRSLTNGETGGAVRLPLTVELCGIQVRITEAAGNTIAAPILYCSASQINFQAPPQLAGGAATVAVVSGGNTVASSGFQIGSGNPSIFLVDPVRGLGAIAFATGPRAGQLVTPENPAQGGEFVSVYANALGPTTPAPPAAGNPASGLSTTVDPVTVKLAGQSVTPSFAGLAPGLVGVYQVNVQIPANLPAGLQTLSLVQAGRTGNSVNLSREGAVVTPVGDQIAYQGASWTLFNSAAYSASVDAATLRIALNRPVLWFENSLGGLVYRLTTGNFKVTALVRARRAADPNQAPIVPISLGGLMARNPAGADQGRPENYVHNVTGNTPAGIGVETKTTLNGSSVYQGVPLPSSDSELRICRVDSAFLLYRRPAGASSWTLGAMFSRPDLPAALQVGANIYSPNGADLRVFWENLRIEPVADMAGCQQ